MDTHLVSVLSCAAAVVVGGVIGLAFGTLQQAALHRHEAQERTGQFKNAWRIMPGSGARIAYLLLALVAIQLLCPILFSDGTQWWVSGGVLAGYGWHLVQRLRRKLQAR